MKFFDYKFLFLLGLTLSIYFIYREVEYLREKIDKLEKKKEAVVKLMIMMTNGLINAAGP